MVIERERQNFRFLPSGFQDFASLSTPDSHFNSVLI